jgi:hypothetical protein
MASLALADLPFDIIVLPLVIGKLMLRFCHKIRIAFGTPQSRATQANSMTEAENSISPRPIDLISTDHL